MRYIKSAVVGIAAAVVAAFLWVIAVFVRREVAMPRVRWGPPSRSRHRGRCARALFATGMVKAGVKVLDFGTHFKLTDIDFRVRDSSFDHVMRVIGNES